MGKAERKFRRESEKKYANSKDYINEMIKASSESNCLWGNGCNGKIIKAHSIQNNRILNKISDDGIILKFNFDLTRGEIEFKEEGRGRFSTFKGFCQKHDKKIFEPIEDREYEQTTEQIYLFAYRAAAQNCHKVKESVNMFNLALKEHFIYNKPQPLYMNFYERNIREEKNKAEITLKCAEKNLARLKQGIENGDYSDLYTKEFLLEKEYPIASVSSHIPYIDYFGRELYTEVEFIDIQEMKILPFIFFTMFPAKGRTYILISCFVENKKYFKEMLDDMSQDIEKIISYYILAHSEIIAFNPTYLNEKFSESEIEQIKETFKSNIKNSHTIKNNYINLFR